LSVLACLYRHAITGIVTTAGRQFRDWSADYRLFSAARVDPEALFAVNRRGVLAELGPEAPLVVAMDDTLLPKSGRKIEGVAWRRDPLGPPFQTNRILAQRFIQRSAALLPQDGPGPCRMVPIGFDHAPSVRKPGKHASRERLAEYKRQQREHNLSRQGAGLLRQLRADLDRDAPGRPRTLLATVDGSCTNRNVLRDLPAVTTLIGRVRADTRLFSRRRGGSRVSGGGESTARAKSIPPH
ncbi:MAG: transposase, partial [Candidatus Lambdaproteobacteria bacterium]|nr:transposase [Candidatus Lambdaproteobacteria bacterium]